MVGVIIFFGVTVLVGFYEVLIYLGKLQEKSDELASTLEDILKFRYSRENTSNREYIQEGKTF